MLLARHTLLALLCLIAPFTQAASLALFAPVYSQVTNEISQIQSSFDGSSDQKQKLASLVRARGAILDPLLTDEQALESLVALLDPYNEYDPLLDEVANGARVSVLGRYYALGERLALLPPSSREIRAARAYNELTEDLHALVNAQGASGIAGKLAPFGRRLVTVSELADRAAILPRPKVGSDAVRATINGKKFSSGPNGTHSPNQFTVTTPSPLYAELVCRVVDKSQVLSISIPVLTPGANSYDIGKGLATVMYTPDVFATEAAPIAATSGTIWVQTTAEEVYGVFTCSGPDFNLNDGRLRIKLPKATQ